jgi:serine/threonine protein kinase
VATFRELTPLGPKDPETVGGYTLRGRVGSGGFKTVYLGISDWGTRAAVGILHEDLAKDDAYRRGFDLEIDAVLLVRGPFVARVTGHEPGADRPWMASEFVNGHSLSRARAIYPFDDESVVLLAAGWARALTDIHKAGVVHRDFKPENVIIYEDGSKVVDFGIAHLPHGDTAATFARAGHPLGTPAYMSPEQAVGEAITTASDVFSWASTVCFSVSGEAPFGSGSAPAVLYRVAHEEPDIPELPEELDGLVRSALAKNPADRPTTKEIVSRLNPQTGLTPSQTATEAAAVLAKYWTPPPELFSTSYPLPEQRTLQPAPRTRTETDDAGGTDIGSPTPPTREPIDEKHQAKRTPEQRRRLIAAGIAVLFLVAYLGNSLGDGKTEVVSPAQIPTESSGVPTESTSLPSSDDEGGAGQDGGGSDAETPSDGDAVLPGVSDSPGNSKDCSDFATYEDAKEWFDTRFPDYGDIAELDRDGDGQPCESLQAGSTFSTTTTLASAGWPYREDCSPRGTSLKIGTLTPQTGDAAVYGSGPRIAVEMVIRSSNEAGGVNGEQVELVVGDEGTTLADTREAIEMLLCEEQVSAIIGPFYHETAEYLPGIASDWPAVLCLNFNHATSVNPRPGFVFQTATDDLALARTLASHVWSEGVRSVAILTEGELFLEDGFIPQYQALGGEIVYQGPISRNALYRLVVLEGVGVVIVDRGNTGFVEDALKRLEETGVSTATHPLYILGRALRDITGVEPGYADLSNFEYMQSFVPDHRGEHSSGFADLQGEDGTSLANLNVSHAADCAALLVLSAYAAGSNSPEDFSQSVISVSRDGTACITIAVCMELLDDGTNIDYEGFSGPVDLDPDGRLTAASFVVYEFGPDGDTFLPDGKADFFLLALAPTLTDPSEPPADLATSCRVDPEGTAVSRELNSAIADLTSSYGKYLDLFIDEDEYLVESDRLLPQIDRYLDDLQALEECLPWKVWLYFSELVDANTKFVDGLHMFASSIRLNSPEMMDAAIAMISDAASEAADASCRLPGADQESLEIFCGG